MSRGCVTAALAAVVLCVATPAAGAQKGHGLEVYSATVSDKTLTELDKQGADFTVRGRSGGKLKVDLILTRGQRAKVAGLGVKTKLTRVKGGKTVKQFAAAQGEDGFTVWR